MRAVALTMLITHEPRRATQRPKNSGSDEDDGGKAKEKSGKGKKQKETLKGTAHDQVKIQSPYRANFGSGRHHSRPLRTA